jgi:hypothetical protein
VDGLTAFRRHVSLAGLGARVSFVVVVIAAAVLSARGRAGALEAEPVAASAEAEAASAEAETDALLAKYFPAPMEGPSLRLAVTPVRLFVDGTFATTNDLSALPYTAGKGHNLRFAVGGSWRWRRFALTGELPYPQVTTLDVTNIPGGTPFPEDAHQTAVSLGDLRLGVDWTEHLSPAIVGGFGLRGRFPTHTTRFQFHQADLTLASYGFPYYFHIEPTGILGGAFGRWTFVVNQGAIVIMGPNFDFGSNHFVEPTLVFWDAHYAVSYAPLDILAASLELATDVQLNHVAGIDFLKLNDVRSVWIAPALQLHLSDYRLDLVARFGLTRGADLFGDIEYAGTNSYMLRVSRTFD